MSGSVRVLKKPRGGENTNSVFEVFFSCANMYFKAKPRKVVGKEGDSFFDVGPGFKKKCTVIYIEHAEYIE